MRYRQKGSALRLCVGWTFYSFVTGHFFEIRLRFWFRLGFAFGLLINSWMNDKNKIVSFIFEPGIGSVQPRCIITQTNDKKNKKRNHEYMSKYKRTCSWNLFHYVKTWYMNVNGLWLRFWCSGFALRGFDQIPGPRHACFEQRKK